MAFEVKLVALILSVLVIGGLIISGPAQAFILGFSVLNTNINPGEVMGFSISVEIAEGEVKDITNFTLEISGASFVSCKFLANTTPIEGCSGITIQNISSTSVYEYGYGYLPGNLTYGVSLNTQGFASGVYSTKLILETESEIIEETGSSISIASVVVPVVEDGGGSSGGGGGGGGGGGAASPAGSGGASVLGSPSNEEESDSCTPDWSCEWMSCEQEGEEFYSYPEYCEDRNNCDSNENFPEKKECGSESQLDRRYSSGITGNAIASLSGEGGRAVVIIFIIGILAPLAGIIVFMPRLIKRVKRRMNPYV